MILFFVIPICLTATGTTTASFHSIDSDDYESFVVGIDSPRFSNDIFDSIHADCVEERCESLASLGTRDHGETCGRVLS